MALIRRKTNKVDYWRNSDEKDRWLAVSLLHIEPRLSRVKVTRYLRQLGIVVQAENEGQITKQEETKEPA
jgi:hypothetical protein